MKLLRFLFIGFTAIQLSTANAKMPLQSDDGVFELPKDVFIASEIAGCEEARLSELENVGDFKKFIEECEGSTTLAKIKEVSRELTSMQKSRLILLLQERSYDDWSSLQSIQVDVNKAFKNGKNQVALAWLVPVAIGSSISYGVLWAFFGPDGYLMDTSPSQTRKVIGPIGPDHQVRPFNSNQ